MTIGVSLSESGVEVISTPILLCAVVSLGKWYLDQISYF